MTITATSASAATAHGCPSGDVCIYPGAGWNNDQPSTIYYGHGCYAFSSQFGTHRILNNGSAPLYGYKGAACATDPVLTIAAGGWADVDLTLVDSIKIA
ncbi:hypothetical protein [Actinoallomurus sp. CA-150999]|uniref:hypothetical protein n=1 Tax=Actinoallomurus sp. CA-150999 TaxID=3239887 RepID=UPI003D8C2142